MEQASGALPPLTALVHEDSATARAVLRAVALGLAAKGLRIAGLLQRNLEGARGGCAMVLDDLASGVETSITQDLGAGAEGCTLDVGQLLRAAQGAEAALDARPHLMILNTFGKTERDGGGLRALLAAALEADIPVLIGVPQASLAAWQAFADDFGETVVLAGEAETTGLLLARFSGSTGVPPSGTSCLGAA